MSKENRFYVTTSIAYVNAAPHVGFAMEMLQADVLARHQRLEGKEVFYLTGTDEHGLKIAQAAEQQGVWPQEFANEIAVRFQDLAIRLGLSNDYFVRTTEEKHVAFAQEMWKKLDAAGDLYKAKYQGLYCVGCEKFVLEKELVEGNCPLHQKQPVKVEEENYFFRLSKYAAAIKSKILANEVHIVPESRRNEVLSFLEDGVTDVSFSRPRQSVKWGIDILGDPDQLMYVWCDALTNYLSVIDREKFWPADVHLIGKDILRFHAVIWLGMLLSAKFELPRTIMVHGYITSEGKKMSKSLGNVKDPFQYLDNYGRDALRYFLLREIPTLDDGDFSQQRFEIVYNDDLANTYGNLVSRVLAMNRKYFQGFVPVPGEDDGFKLKVAQTWLDYEKCLAEFDLKKALETVLALGFAANKYVEDSKPWVLAKENPEKLPAVLYNLLELIRQLGLMLMPFLPDKAGEILRIFDPDFQLQQFSWAGRKDWALLKEGQELGHCEVLFPKIEAN
jgi:methionyl-tRNA synthetase